MRIEPLTRQNAPACAAVLRQPFAVIGRLLPEYRDGRWSAQEELFPAAREKTYPDDVDLERFLREADCAGFAAREGERVAGVLLLEAYWNRYAFVHELAVDRERRGQGVGTRLMDCARAWARERGLHGLMLETQDDNLLACRFYRKCGLRIGGIDEKLYAGFGSREKAVFWYLELEAEGEGDACDLRK